MKLTDVAYRLRTGDVLLFKGRSWFARLIRRWTQSDYTHAGILLYQRADGEGRWCVLEALEPGGVRLFPLDVYLRQCARQGVRVDWYATFDPAVRTEKVAAFALRQWGKRYVSPWQFLLSFGRLNRLGRRLLGLRAPILDRDRFFCSELVACALKHAGARLPDQPVITPPSEIASFACLHYEGELTP